jgi:hypothetical protein
MLIEKSATKWCMIGSKDVRGVDRNRFEVNISVTRLLAIEEQCAIGQRTQNSLKLVTLK